MSSESYKNFKQHHLGLKLTPIFVAQLGLLESLHYPAYSHSDGSFNMVLEANEGITNEFIRSYAQEISKEIFIHKSDKEEIQEKLSDQLTRLTRSMGITDQVKKGARQCNLLSLQMANLYQDPFNDELLNNQFQGARNLSTLLYNNKHIHKALYNHIKKQGHHYTIKQPLLSSVLLLSFIQYTQMFTEKEIQSMFLTSYFKDIGMSFIPREKFELATLSDVDRALFSQHAKNSMEILQGRVQLSNNQLKMIENHHFLNYIVQAKAQNLELTSIEVPIAGIESILMSCIDVIVAMTSERPYRDPVSIYRALEFMKRVIGEEFPQEFKLLVMFMRQFFSK